MRDHYREGGHLPHLSSLILLSQNLSRICRLDFPRLRALMIHLAIRASNASLGSIIFKPLIVLGAQTSVQQTRDLVCDEEFDERKFLKLERISLITFKEPAHNVMKY